ncbi:D-2-hydroxyacid dehydrogenase [Petrocella sp. FN5]|uniref:D-2-hydroxyacid dehydrogenase n=1 Tax=Petrocella sp. FN5 TaxID=3032002 RepID=UPI0023DBDCAF|nr:D-2-hydroxyacid dehydrogenase [Petrocella sp. FN5]MDF1616539.1 D-2-hydroxyacid dehydrogenase [Petrocella sp. FN5]
MKIVLLDQKSLGEKLDFKKLESIGSVTYYNYTNQEQIIERCAEAEVVITNKGYFDEKTIGSLKHLKLICMTGTGYDKIDIQAAKSNKVGVCNVLDYCSNSVAQHTLALVLQLVNHMSYYERYVKSGKYIDDDAFTHYEVQINEIAQMTWGIVGMGSIGSKVAKIAESMGAKVIYYSTSGKNQQDIYKRVSFEDLLSRSQIITIHAPLNEQTKNLFSKAAFSKMKNTPILVNVGRGAIVNEEALVEALSHNRIAGVALDVLNNEPMSKNSKLIPILDDARLVITPHVAWASLTARQKVVDEVARNIIEYVKGNKYQRVDL